MITLMWACPVSVSRNGRQLSAVASTKLARGVLAIYLGEKPAVEDLRLGCWASDKVSAKGGDECLRTLICT